MSELSKEEKSILTHTRDAAPAGRFCGDSPEMQHLVSLGLMESAGRLSFVPDEYFRLTAEGQRAVRGG